MHSFWFFFLKKREFTWLLMFSLIGLGTYCVFIIPKESSPEVIVPIGIVTTVYPGASASDVEELITDKLESNFGNLDELDTITSVSQDSASAITVQFNANADVDKSIQKLKDAVDAVKNDLPSDVQSPSVIELNFADQPIHIISISSDLDPVSFTKLGEELVTKFKSVRGVSEVDLSGTRDRQVQVVVREETLSAYSLTINDVVAALAGANLSMPVGSVLTDGIEYSIRFNAQIESSEDIQNIPVPSRSAMPVYIRDVATVINGVDTQNTITRVSVDGSPSQSALTLSIYKQSGFDVTEMSSNVHEEIELLQTEGGLLEDSQVLFVFDQGEQVKKDLSALVKAGFETVLLVVICLLLTIGWRESLVAALSIPLSFVIAFIGLYASGNTINFISLFSLILAVGILVDSGIVITEAIHTRMRKFGDPTQAAQAAIKEYSWPLIGGTMTTIAVFAPLFFLSGIMGKFIASIPFTIIFVLLASIFVSLGLVPLLAIILTSRSKPNKLEVLQEEYTHKAQQWYRAHLVSFLKNVRAQRIFLWTLFVGFLLVFVLPMSGLLKVVFFPVDDVDYVYIDVETKQGTPVEQTDLALRQVEEILYEKPYIESFSTTAGSASFFTGGTGTGGKYGNITVELKSDRTESSIQISDELRDELQNIKDAKVSIQEQENGPPSGAPVTIKFFGDDIVDLGIAVDSAQSILNEIKGTQNISVSTDDNAIEYVFTVDTAKADALGVSIQEIGTVLRTAVYGTKATTFKVGSTDVDIVVKLATNASTNDPSATPVITLDVLDNLTVQSTTGNSVPLNAVLIQSLAPANTSITHEDSKRVETVSAYVADGVTASEVVAQFQQRENQLDLAEGVTISYGGETEDINQSFTEMFIALIVGLLLMLAILVLAFNSIRYSFYLLLAVPYSLIGVFIGLTITGLALSFTSLLGVIALAGVIINHAIILMDSMITHKASSDGSQTLIENVADASVSRFRPILLTTLTTVVGMIPLSHISGLWGPLAFAIMFGLSFAMILTLLLVPTLYYRAEKKKEEKRLHKI
jgi:multidrug efflux pump subunit AcrB